MKNFLFKGLMVGSMIATPLLSSTTAQASNPFLDELKHQLENDASSSSSTLPSVADLKSEVNPDATPRFSPQLNASSAGLGKDEQVANNPNRNFNAFDKKDEEWKLHNPHADKSVEDLNFGIDSHTVNLKNLQDKFANEPDEDKSKLLWAHIVALNKDIKLQKQHLPNALAQDQKRAEQAQRDLEAKKQKFIETGVIDD